MNRSKTNALWIVALGVTAGCGGDPETDVLASQGESACVPGSVSVGPRVDPTEPNTFSIPFECSKVTLKLWGAGGSNGPGAVKGSGGGGGYTEVTFDPAIYRGTEYSHLKLTRGFQNGNASHVNLIWSGSWGPMIAVAGGGGSAGVALPGHPAPGNGGGAEVSGTAGGLGTGGVGAGVNPGTGGTPGGCAGTGPGNPIGGGYMVPGHGGTSGGTCYDYGKGGDGFNGGGQGGAHSGLLTGGGGGGGSNYIWPTLSGTKRPGGTPTAANADDRDRCQGRLCSAGDGGTPDSVEYPNGTPGRVVMIWE